MKTGIMGGTFDPIHIAHLIIPRYAKEQFGLDRIIFMPGGSPPHKPGVTDKHLRLEMTRLGVDGEFDVSDYEVRKDEYSYTLKTLEYLKEKYPNDELFFIIGEDSLRDISKWYRPEDILSLCTLLVFPRISGASLSEAIAAARKRLNGKILAVNAPVFGISSSEIRYRLSEGKSVRHMTPDSVIEFIEKNGLYKNNGGDRVG